MRPRFRALSLVVAIVIAVTGSITIAPGTSYAASGPMNPGIIGANAVNVLVSSGQAQVQEINSVRDQRFQAIRLSIEWPNVEKTQGVFDWTSTDAMVRSAYDAGLNILGVATYTPAWAATAEGRNFLHPGPADPAQYANFVRLAAQRYKGAIRNWEIWNEPNVQTSFAPKPDAAKYTTMLKLSYAAIKAVDPYSVVITGGTSPSLDDGTDISPAVFVQNMYQNGAKGSFDGIGMHPYSAPDLISEQTDWWTSKNAINMVWYLMNQNGDGQKRMWYTEFGASTSPTPQTGVVSEARQAQILVDGIKYLRSIPNGGPIFVFDHRDLQTGSSNSEFNYGLLRTDFSAKPAMAAVQQLIR